jgi:hypothetical protein
MLRILAVFIVASLIGMVLALYVTKNLVEEEEAEDPSE